MEVILYILAKAVAIYLSVAAYAMLGRVILQFFVVPEESRLFALCFFISEPCILPFRIIFAKLNIGQGVPIDIPFMVGYISVALIQMIMPAI